MSTTPKINKNNSLENHKIIPSKTNKNISFNVQPTIIMNPIKHSKVSKNFGNNLNVKSIIKAGLVALGTLGLYYLGKTSNIFSYFGSKEKISNSKDMNDNQIMKVKNIKNALNIRKNLETENKVENLPRSQIKQMYKNDKTIEFEEIKVKEFKDFSKPEESMKKRRSNNFKSISIKNPIPNQHVVFGNSFNLTIDGTSVFNSSGALFLETTNIPTWLTSLNLSPTFKGSYDINLANGVALSGNYAYVAAVNSGLQIIDISDPSNPTFKGSYHTPDYTNAPAVSENYAYVGVMNSALQIIDISNPSNPTLKGSCDVSRFAIEVALFENYAYVANYNSGLQIIDISDPSNPTFKGSYDTPGYADGVAVSGNYAYVANWHYRNGTLQIINISDPSNPTFKSSYDTPGRAYGVTLFGDYAYVADWTSGLQIIAPNLDKLILSGTPNSTGTYKVDIKACNEAKECVTDIFDIIVKNSSSTDIDLITILVIISSITVVICSTASFCCIVITSGGIVTFVRYRNKKALSGSSEEKASIFSVNSKKGKTVPIFSINSETGKLEKENV